MTIRLTIPEVLPGQNVLLRMHWAKRMRVRKRVAWYMKAALLEKGSGWKIGNKPLEKCRITVTRHCRRKLDADNSVSSVKALLDVLQPHSKTHPDGLGVIQNDSESCIVEPVRVIQEKGTAKTVVEIEEVV